MLFILPYNYYFLTKWACLTSTEVFYMVLPFSSLQDIRCCVPCAVSLAFKVCVMLMHHFSQHFFFYTLTTTTLESDLPSGQFLHYNCHNSSIIGVNSANYCKSWPASPPPPVGSLNSSLAMMIYLSL